MSEVWKITTTALRYETDTGTIVLGSNCLCDKRTHKAVYTVGTSILVFLPHALKSASMKRLILHPILYLVIPSSSANYPFSTLQTHNGSTTPRHINTKPSFPINLHTLPLRHIRHPHTFTLIQLIRITLSIPSDSRKRITAIRNQS